MKRYILTFITALFILVSCEKEEEPISQGVPFIERVRLSDPATADSSLSSATLGSTLVIVGNNLGSVEAVFINNYRVGVNAAYATNNHLIVSVSDSVPTVATDPDVPNVIKVVNPFGEAVYQFQVLPPAPVVEQISNQYAGAGEPITLYGKYFYFVDSVLFPGDVYLTGDFASGSGGATLTVTIPPGFDPSGGGDLIVSTKSGNSQANRATRFYDGDGMVADFDTDGALVWPDNWGWGIPNANITSTAPGIQPIDGSFGLINMTLPPDWGWANEKVINLVNWGGEQIYPTVPPEKYDPGVPIADFDIRMEVAVSAAASLAGIELQVMYQNENNTELSANVSLTDFVRSTDGKWYTVSVPLNTLTNANSRMSTYDDLLKGNADGQHHLRVVLVNPTPAPVPVVFAVDNIRVVNAEAD
ncbi:hypothetical protein EDD80_101129 [Anseongella ginsenosidimutans]|uniref:Surface glycan-binding protein B xyloglucan binding domain-containing protein n=1 Tax=Anseongella ginsenosidimutans TaxID=496056 RepID=A0A4R3L0G8_9SPHI|nr:glycan-binding surface protein [Anseongella ginsenosidimutans]QEC51366.1 hypothetical protein FRZ59_02710 [Anseongella ginsenosidimutans]TCS89932.1 hypothetical protein EDD80_101129 [Anseongella ginsenosidimutans]